MTRWLWFIVAATLVGCGLARSAQPPPANAGKSGKLTAEEIGKQWGFDSAAFQAAFQESMKYASGWESNGDKLKWGQITVKLTGRDGPPGNAKKVTRSYEAAYPRVVKFYADRIGYNYVFNRKKMDIRKGKNEKGRFIFCDIGFKPREASFVYNTATYTLNGFIRPAPAKDTVEITLSIAVR